MESRFRQLARPHPRDMALQAGTSLGPYQVESPLGAGGMGEVYKARDTRLDRTVAIKVLPEHVAADPDLKQRFEREAKTVAALSHPNICPVFDVGSQDGIDFLVMEYLEGETLAQRLEKGALGLDQALQVAIEIADALDKAHRQGIVHRDLKPGNIMLTKTGAKLLDFGLAKLRQPGMVDANAFSAAATRSEPLTGKGTLLGTLQYMAPEQLEGKDADHRTDIFAFGTLVYEMATGQRAFAGDSQASLIAAILDREPVPMSTLQQMTPARLDEIVKTCLAKDRDDRWQSAGDVGRQLKGIIEGSSPPSAAVPVSTAPHPVSWRRAGIASLATLAVGGTIVGLAVWGLVRPSPEPLARFVISAGESEPVFISPLLDDLAISRDGQHFAFLAGNRPSVRLLVRAVDELVPTTLVSEGNLGSPFFSPDGEWLGYLDVNDAVIKKVSVHGGPTVTVQVTAALAAVKGPPVAADDIESRRSDRRAH